MRKRMLSLALALVVALSLAAPAFAFTTPDFTDLPSDNWAYEPVMRMADAGVIKGTGNGAFSPEMKVSAAQFLTLVGRVVFPDVKAEGADWYGPYIQEAQSKGLLDGTQVDTSKPEAEISRYDMAVILRGAAKVLGIKETMAQENQVTDFGDIPNRYTEAVLAVYGTGLITGDQNGSFNGTNTMMRNETATVLDRLIALPEQQAKAEQEEADRKAAEAQAAFEASRTGEYITVNFYGRVTGPVPAGTRVGLYYKDGRLLGETTTDGSLDAGNYALWSMNVTMDKADHSWTEKLYYVSVIGQVERNGLVLETPAWVKDKPESIYDNTLSHTTGFLARLEPIQEY